MPGRAVASARVEPRDTRVPEPDCATDLRPFIWSDESEPHMFQEVRPRGDEADEARAHREVLLRSHHRHPADHVRRVPAVVVARVPLRDVVLRHRHALLRCAAMNFVLDDNVGVWAR
jgi:hypothetical protein